MAKRLGLNETQAVLFALARLRDEVLTAEPVAEPRKDFAPMTRQQHAAIAKAETQRRGKVIDSLLG